MEWNALVNASASGTWFQGPEAYSFYESLPDLFQPFVLLYKIGATVVKIVKKFA